MQRVDFAYHAVVGFIGIWIFAGHAKELPVHHLTPGINAVLDRCERTLPHFERRSVSDMVASGDVEDEIEVWKRVPPG